MSERRRRNSKAKGDDQVRHVGFIADTFDSKDTTTQTKINGRFHARSESFDGISSEASSCTESNSPDSRRKSAAANSLPKFRERIVDGTLVGLHLCDFSLAGSSVSDAKHTDCASLLHESCDACRATASSGFAEPRRVAAFTGRTFGADAVKADPIRRNKALKCLMKYAQLHGPQVFSLASNLPMSEWDEESIGPRSKAWNEHFQLKWIQESQEELSKFHIMSSKK